MNAAFLLVTSTWLVGGQAAPPAPPPGAPTAPPAQMAPAPSYGSGGSCGSCSSCGGGSSCGSCGSSCGCEEKPSFLERLKGRFHRDRDCGCAAAPAPCQTCAPAPVYHTAPCGSCGSACDSCDKPGFLDRLKARFHRDRDNDCGCGGAPACNSCGGGCASGGYANTGAMPLPPVKAGEPIKGPADGPMKLPTGDKPKETSAPKNLELTPTGGGDKIIESGTKNPF